MPKIKITADTIEQFFALYQSGLTQRDAAAQLGVGLESIRRAATRLDIAWPVRDSIRQSIIERADEIRSSKRTQKQWAEEFGTSQARIAILFQKLGLKSKFGGGSGRQADYRKKYNEFRRILAYVAENGGYVTHAISALGLKTQAQEVREYARKTGFNLDHYQFAFQEYGEWLVLPGPWERKLPNNYLVPALCRSCGEIFKLNLQNARVGKTNCCQLCASLSRNNSSVVNVATGEEYSSIMSWTKAIGHLKNYQRLRIQLNRARAVTVDGIEYRLIDSQ